MGPTNAEASEGDKLFEKIRAARSAIGADTATLIENGKDGLNKTEVRKQLASVALEGNARVKLEGTVVGGAPFDVGTDELRLRIPMTNVPDELDEKARRMKGEFDKAIGDGTIIVAKMDEEQAKRIRGKFNF